MPAALSKPAVRFFESNLPGGLGIGATQIAGPIAFHGMLNGRLRGNVHQDVAGTLLVEQGIDTTAFDLAFTVTQDLTQPGFQYPFDIIIIQPFIRITFTNGAGASAFFRGYYDALPT